MITRRLSCGRYAPVNRGRDAVLLMTFYNKSGSFFLHIRRSSGGILIYIGLVHKCILYWNAAEIGMFCLQVFLRIPDLRPNTKDYMRGTYLKSPGIVKIEVAVLAPIGMPLAKM